jgi:hypothetical protein
LKILIYISAILFIAFFSFYLAGGNAREGRLMMERPLVGILFFAAMVTALFKSKILEK